MATAADLIYAAAAGAVPAGVAVSTTIIPGIGPARYVLLFIPDDSLSASALDAVSDQVAVEFHVLCVVSNDLPQLADAECRDLTRRVRLALTDLTISPTGMSPARITQRGRTGVPQPDETTPNKKVYTQMQFGFDSVTA